MEYCFHRHSDDFSNCWSISKRDHLAPREYVSKIRKHGVYDPIAELVRVNPVASIIVDTETFHIVIANEAVAQLLGYRTAQLEEHSLLEFVPMEDVAAVQHAAEEPPPEGETRWRCLRKDGSLVYVKVKYRDTIFRGRPARFVVATESSTAPFH